jgi:hypothetical protein
MTSAVISIAVLPNPSARILLQVNAPTTLM